ncbi:MAG: tetratricopeptide repeat protein [Pseudomonadales bacterium]
MKQQPKPSRRLMVLAAVLLLVSPAFAAASTTLLLNESPAQQCYQAALRRDGDDGIEDCDLAIEHQALGRVDMASTLSNRGLLLARGGDLKAALKDHNRAVKLAPELCSVLINRANVFTRTQQFESALNDLDQAVMMDDPVRHLAYYNRALLHQRLGNTAAAREDAEQAVTYGPDIEAYARYLETLIDPEPVTASPKGRAADTPEADQPKRAKGGWSQQR